jgi:hypothetical protein
VPITTYPDLSKPVRTPEGFKVPPGFEVELKDERSLDFEMTLTAKFDESLGHYVAETLTIRPEITGERLRQVKVAELPYHGAIAATSGSVPPTDELRKLRSEGPTDRVP